MGIKTSDAWKKNVNFSGEVHKRRARSTRSFEREAFMYSKMGPLFKSGQIASFLDIGCGDGSFLRYLSRRNPKAQFTGIEYDGELAKIATEAHPEFTNVKLLQGDAVGFRLDRKFDAALLAGVLSIFDDAEAPLKNLLRHLKPGGRGYLLGGFCSAPVDVLVRYRVLNGKSDAWQSGLNMISLQTLKKILSPHCSSVRWWPFRLKKVLPRRSDPTRSFTLRTTKGNVLVNGANVVREFFLVEFRKNKR